MARNEKGQFVKGNSGGPGRPRREVEAEYTAALIGRVSVTDWAAIVDRAVVDAKRGNPTARKWLSDYILGLPVQRMEHTGADGGPIEAKGYVGISPDDWDKIQNKADSDV